MINRILKIIILIACVFWIILISIELVLYQVPNWILTGKEIRLKLNKWSKSMSYVFNV